MATAQMDTVIRHLRRAVLRRERADSTDGQLLSSFIDQKDEAAFETLVRRHGPMVFGVCCRVVGNHHDAEDAFQATFLVLARKAPSVRPREQVANWLHGVALRTAMKAKAMTVRRRGREKQVTEIPEPEAAQQGQWRDLQPLLDQELNGLPENYRLPILLCDLEGKTIKEATQQLGWPQGTLAGRLARGRKLLAKRLASRGVVLSAGSLAAVISQNVASAGVPTSLMSSTVKAATLIAAGQEVAGMVPAKVAALTEGVMTSMMPTRIKIMAGVIGVLGMVAFAGGQLMSPTATAQPPERAMPMPSSTASKPFATKVGNDSSMGYIKSKRDRQGYSAVFEKSLEAMAEHFEDIRHANRYDGRIEAWSPQPVDREGFLSIQACEDGYYIAIRINKVIAGETGTVRDTELERAILQRLNALQDQTKMPPAGQREGSSPLP